MQSEDPVKLCFKAVNEVMFNKHPYSKSIIGSKASLAKVTRKSLADLHKSHLEKSNIVFTYCGDLELEDVMEKISFHIDRFPTQKGALKLIPQAHAQIKDNISVSMDREQCQIFLGYLVIQARILMIFT